MHETREETRQREANEKRRERKRKECSFCGTADKAHNVKPTFIDSLGRSILLCDNPVCNALK